MKYKEQLEDFRWIKKRAKIIKRDRFKCSKCNKEEDLNVHHKYYISGHKAWEYPNSALITLCSKCHNEWHSINIVEIRQVYFKNGKEYIIKPKKKKKGISYSGYNTPYKGIRLTEREYRKLELERYKARRARKKNKI